MFNTVLYSLFLWLICGPFSSPCWMGVEQWIGKDWDIGDLYLIEPTETEEKCKIKTSVRTASVPARTRNTPPPQHTSYKFYNFYDMIYLLTAIGLSPGGSSTIHIYTQTIHRTIQNKQYIEQHNNWKIACRAPSWLVMPWHLPYNQGKSTGKPQSG